MANKSFNIISDTNIKYQNLNLKILYYIFQSIILVISKLFIKYSGL